MQFVNHSGSTQRARETNTLQLALNWDPRFRGFAQSVGQNHKKKLVCLMLLWFVVSFHPKMTTILCRKSLTLCGYPLICWMRHVSFKRCGAHTFYMDGSSSELQDSKHSKHEPKHHSDAIAKLAKLMQLLSLLVGLSKSTLFQEPSGLQRQLEEQRAIHNEVKWWWTVLMANSVILNMVWKWCRLGLLSSKLPFQVEDCLKQGDAIFQSLLSKERVGF